MDLSSITGMFVGVHALLAANLEQPALVISEAEGKLFMGAVQNVMRHYSVQTTQKTLDWIALFGVGAGMYVPRIAAVSIGRKQRARAARTNAPQRPNPQTQFAPPSIVPDQFGGGFQDLGDA